MSHHCKQPIDNDLLKVEEIRKRIEKISGCIDVNGGQDIVSFIGPAGAGKSTLINCLMDNHLVCKSDPETEETYIVRGGQGDLEGPIIAHNAAAKSTLPKQFSSLPGTSWPMWDFPGFGNITGAEQEIANATIYEKVIGPQKSVRFVLVVPISMIKSDNPMEFLKLLSSIVLLTPGIAGSFCIVATKSEKGSVASWLDKVVSSPFSKVNNENMKIVNIAYSAINSVLKNGLCIDFKAPLTPGDGLDYEFTPPNKMEIIDLIQKLKGKSVNDIPLSISDQSKHEILMLHTAIDTRLKEEIDSFTSLFDGNSVADMSQITEIIQSASDFKSVLEVMKKNGFEVRMLTKSLDAVKYIELIQNKFKINNSRADEQDGDKILKRIQRDLKLSAQRNSEKAKIFEAAQADSKMRLENQKIVLERRKKEHEMEMESMKMGLPNEQKKWGSSSQAGNSQVMNEEEMFVANAISFGATLSKMDKEKVKTFQAIAKKSNLEKVWSALKRMDTVALSELFNDPEIRNKVEATYQNEITNNFKEKEPNLSLLIVPINNSTEQSYKKPSLSCSIL